MNDIMRRLGMQHPIVQGPMGGGPSTPELVAAVDRGDTSVSAAAEVATQPIERQLKLVAAGEKEIIAAASKIRTEKRERKAKARAAQRFGR